MLLVTVARVWGGLILHFYSWYESSLSVGKKLGQLSGIVGQIGGWIYRNLVWQGKINGGEFLCLGKDMGIRGTKKIYFAR